MRASSAGFWGAFFAAWSLVACAGPEAYRCSATQTCSAGAVCLPEGHCAREDRTCGSGYRYTASGPEPNACAPAQEAGAVDAAIDARPDAADAAADAALVDVPGDLGDANADAASDANADGANDTSDADAASDAFDAFDAPADAPFDAAVDSAPDAPFDAADVVEEREPRCPTPAPRLVAPISPYRVVSQRPQVAYVVAAAVRSVELELARTRDFAAVVHRQTVTIPSADAGPVVGQISPVLPEGSMERLAPGAWFWRARGVCSSGLRTEDSPTWQFRVLADASPGLPIRGLSSLRALPGGLDLNGDGFDDVVVGAPGAHAVYVYYGGATPTAPVEVTANADRARSPFGALIANAGDVNGDGFGDVLIGSCPRYSTDITEPCSTGFSVLYGGPRRASRGDLVDVPVPTAVGPVTRAASALDGVGDLNFDGYADVAVGSTGNALLLAGQYNNSANAAVVLGGPTGLGAALLLPLEAAGATAFGQSIAGPGAFDDTGVAGVHLTTEQRAVRPTMFDAMGMRVALPYATSTAGSMNDFGLRGAVLAAGGDLNGDGRSELLVGNEAYSFGFSHVNVGACFSVTGAAVACTTIVDRAAEFTGERRVSLSGGGDVNRDGFDDVLFAVRSVDGSRPAELHFTAGGPAREAVATRRVTCPRAWPGATGGRPAAASIVGDYNGDGFDDMVVSTAEAPTTPGSGATDRLELFAGGASANLAALCETPTALELPTTLTSTSRFGYALR